jgi:hypothetical protein
VAPLLALHRHISAQYFATTTLHDVDPSHIAQARTALRLAKADIRANAPAHALAWLTIAAEVLAPYQYDLRP